MNMTSWDLPGSIDTIFLVVYEPHRALDGLQGVGFHGKKSACCHLEVRQLLVLYSFFYVM